MIRQADTDLEAELNRKYPGRKVRIEDGAIVIRIPMVFKKAGGRKEIILPEGMDIADPHTPQPQRPLVIALAKAFKWQKMMESSEVGSIKELAWRNGVNPSYIARILRLATLAPDIIEAILWGDTPDGISLRRLQKGLPVDWREQRERWGVGG